MWLRVIASLALFGFLVGMMIGRVFYPGPADSVMLEKIEPAAGVLTLWFTDEPKVREGHLDGALVLDFDATGNEQDGRLQLNSRDVIWKVQKTAEGLSLTLVAARRLSGTWAGTTVEGRWRLKVSLAEE